KWIIGNIKNNPTQKPVVMMGFSGGLGVMPSLEAEIDALIVTHGAVVVISAGNYAADACQYAPGGQGVKGSNFNRAITVGSVDPDDQVSPFSNTGNCVDIFAPGSNIVSAVPKSGSCYQSNFTALSGTSQAAAHVAGVAALYWEAAVNLATQKMA